MTDGAHLGVSASRALDTILGGDPPPTEDEQVSMAEMEKRIRSRPLPGDGPKPWEVEGEDGYSVASECIAHAFLALADDDPTLLTRREVYTEADFENTEGDWWKSLVGRAKDPDSVAWDALKKRWPGANEWFGGATGFMVGWAFNAARAIKGEPPASNPAIVTIGGGDS